jgi:hypothetical protein
MDANEVLGFAVVVFQCLLRRAAAGTLYATRIKMIRKEIKKGSREITITDTHCIRPSVDASLLFTCSALK